MFQLVFWKAVMIVFNEMIYFIGLAMIGLSILLAFIVVPVLFITGRRIKKQLEADYGMIDHQSKN